MTSIRVLLVGCGNMGYAMLSGWINSGKLDPSETLVVEPNAELRDRAARLGSKVAASADDIPADAAPELIVIAVKPQVIREVVAGYRRFAGASDISQHRRRHRHCDFRGNPRRGHRRSCAACRTRPRRSARA